MASEQVSGKDLGARWRRLTATAIDCATLMFSVQALVAAVGVQDFISAETIEWDVVGVNAGFGFVMILVLFILPVALKGQTVGKFLLGLRVAPGSPGTGMPTAVRRYVWLLLAYLPGNIFVMTLALLISLVLMLRSKEHKSVADLFASTLVIKTRHRGFAGRR